MTTHETLSTWSRLSLTPACAYHPRSDSHLVYWQGIAMVRASALLCMSMIWNAQHPSPKMKQMAYQEMVRAYRLGAFGDVNWDAYLRYDNDGDPAGRYLSYLSKWLRKRDANVFAELRESYSVQEALAWFSPENEQVFDG